MKFNKSVLKRSLKAVTIQTRYPYYHPVLLLIERSDFGKLWWETKNDLGPSRRRFGCLSILTRHCFSLRTLVLTYGGRQTDRDRDGECRVRSRQKLWSGLCVPVPIVCLSRKLCSRGTGQIKVVTSPPVKGRHWTKVCFGVRKCSLRPLMNRSTSV